MSPQVHRALRLVVVVLVLLVAVRSCFPFDEAQAAQATKTVRGLFYRVGPDGRSYPASGVKVRLNHRQHGPSTFSYSNESGMYYIQNVPPGRFWVEVWVTDDPKSVRVFTVDVIWDGKPFTDVPPIRVP